MSFSAVFAAALLLLPTLPLALSVSIPIDISIGIGIGKCDLYKGRWEVDGAYPLYPAGNCPFVLQQFNCIGNGRAAPDIRYQTYRWKPKHCALPRWDGVEFARKMRGKRLMFVGDSISLNQWQSLACMVLAAHPNASYRSTRTGPLSTILFTELNVTLLFMRNAFLVDLVTENGLRVLKLDSVAVGSTQWLPNDVLIFDTWHWWLYTGRQQEWDIVQENNVNVSDVDRLAIYERGMRTWGRWVDQNVDTTRVKIFFQGVSPDHWNASTWGRPELQRCRGEQIPLDQPVEESNFTTAADNVIKRIIDRMNKPVHILDIIKSSQFRADGHPSIYGNPSNRGMDCTHWCLPGVPDTWNEFLYAALSYTLI